MGSTKPDTVTKETSLGIKGLSHASSVSRMLANDICSQGKVRFMVNIYQMEKGYANIQVVILSSEQG